MLSDKHPIRVLVVEDSPTVRHYLMSLINETPGLEVVGEARNGDEALEMTAELRPDVISMDIRMPGVDGLEATRRIMNRHPTPVVIVSGLLEREVDLSFQALQAGALAVVEKPPYRHDPNFSTKQRQMVNTLTAMARVHVVRRWENEPGQNSGVENPSGKRRITTERLRPKPEIIAIGASAGGPGALATLLRNLPVDFSVPIIIAQHIPHEFVNGLARWLGKASPLSIRVASENLVLEPGVVHLAPGFAHGMVARQGDKLVTRLIPEKGPYRYQPSVDVLFESVANVCGPAAVGIVLTGMGDDGAAGLLAMRRAGAHTFAQDEATSTVFGMPQAAIARGAVEHVLALSNLATTLTRFNLM
jgi:two-component system chemotaxis response regulator CheB